MPNARNILNVTFKEAVEKIRGVRKAEMVVRFRYLNYDNEEVVVKSIKLSKLYKDWYNECNICPANDTPISHLRILLNQTCTALDINENITFENLMNAVEEVTAGYKYNKE